jgi:hypothetical protein
MTNVHAERSAGWSAICFVVLTVAATVAVGSLPNLSSKPTDLAAAFDLARSGLLWGAWLTFPSGAFFLWFLVGLRGYLRQAPGRQEGLPAFAFSAGIVLAAQAFLAAFLQAALAYMTPSAFVADGMAGVYAILVFTIGGLGWAPLSVFLFAGAHSMRRHHSAPGWLAWLGYLAAFTAALATLSIFTTDPSLGPTGMASIALGGGPALLWLIGTGVTLIRAKEVPAA